MDWLAVFKAHSRGQLLDLLLTLPVVRWTEQDKYGRTFLHLAATGGNLNALVALIRSGANVNARDRWQSTPVHYAAIRQPRELEVLCAVGADLRTCNRWCYSALDSSIVNGAEACARVLVANGVRLSTANEREHRFITPKLEAFERGVLRCRTAVVAMLRVKRKADLFWWDKFLLRELAYAIWATRYDKQWQK